MSASIEWADRAVKLRFGPKVRPVLSEGHALIVFEKTGDHVVLGSGATWEEAVQKAIELHPEMPQPPPVMTPPPAPEGEEYIEEFVKSMRQRDILSEFLLWYGEKGDKEPEAYPRALHRGEWFDQLSAFFTDIEK